MTTIWDRMRWLGFWAGNRARVSCLLKDPLVHQGRFSPLFSPFSLQLVEYLICTGTVKYQAVPRLRSAPQFAIGTAARLSSGDYYWTDSSSLDSDLPIFFQVAFPCPSCTCFSSVLLPAPFLFYRLCFSHHLHSGVLVILVSSSEHCGTNRPPFMSSGSGFLTTQ
ncbi:uncharacterized protein BJX67DRAFT_307089 [Aspergillus lucknowensis]|uniref:Uncharacterized protein n=1 Tax=Aspergillus lucknowensis TaxID=176173 RepID=A0ABR4LZZ3_9EURO